MALVESLKIFGEASKSSGSTPGRQGGRLCTKCESVVARNPDFCDLKKIAATMDGSSMTNDLPHNLYELASFEYAPITFVDAERSFSRSKYTLNDRRQNFKFENLKMALVARCDP